MLPSAANTATMGPARRLALWFGLCTILIAMQCVHAIIDSSRGGGSNILDPILWEASSIDVLGALMVGIYRFGRRFPFSRDHWRIRLLQHLGAALVYAVLHFVGMFGIRLLVYALVGKTYEVDWPTQFGYELSKDLPGYVFIMAGCHAFFFLEDVRREREQRLRLEAELSGLQLRLLRDRLRPHFLFNTLNLISSIMYEDVEKADKLMADLCSLLRHSIDESRLATASLAEEQRFLELYLAIIHERFGPRLQTHVAIEPECLGARVPRYLLQPLVENAIEHGFSEREGRGTIWVEGCRRDGRLYLEVRDDGLGLKVSPEHAFRKGLGLSNTRQTLEHLFGDRCRIEIGNRESGGVRVLIELPLEPAVTAAEGAAMVGT